MARALDLHELFHCLVQFTAREPCHSCIPRNEAADWPLAFHRGKG